MDAMTMDVLIPIAIAGAVMLLIWAALHYCGYYADGTETEEVDDGEFDRLPECWRTPHDL